MSFRGEDLTGNHYGHLTVLGYTDNQGWKCRCDCGKEIYVQKFRLTNGIAKSCGCSHYTEMKKFDLTGQAFGEWTVLKSVRGGWLCRCSCGIEREVRGISLRQGLSTNCGHPQFNVGDILKGYEIIEVVDAGKNVSYRCKCQYCGDIVNKKQFWTEHLCQRQDKITEKLSQYYVEGTNTQNLKSALNGVTPKNNTSGVRGVYYDKSLNTYKAIIKFQQKNYYLGSGDIEYCTKLRKEAEKRIYGEFLDWYESIKKEEKKIKKEKQI